MAGVVRDLTDLPLNSERTYTTSSSASEPDIIDPPGSAQYVSIEFTSTAGNIQRDSLPVGGSSAETTFLSATLASGKYKALQADALYGYPCTGRFALSSGGTSVTYTLSFSHRKP